MKLTNAEFAVLVETHQSRANAVAYRLVRNPEDAREVVQEAFLRAFLHQDAFDGYRASFGTWLYRIVTNLSIDALRKRGGRMTTELEESVESEIRDPHDSLQQKESVERFEAVLDSLPAEHRIAFVLYEVEELTYEQLSAKTGVPIGTVMSRLFHARRKLREAVL